MKRVVVTGMGIWSCIGQDLQTVTESLKQGRSGIIFDPKRIEMGLQCGYVGHVPFPNLKPLLPRRFRTTMSEDASLAYMVTRQAFMQSQITEDYLSKNEVGVIWGSEGDSHFVKEMQIIQQEHNSLLIDPNAVFKSFASSEAANIATSFNLRGINLSTEAGCASASHAIGLAMMYIKSEQQDVILVGGTSLSTSMLATIVGDACIGKRVLVDSPQAASRPFDQMHSGVISSEGSVALVLEDYDHAIARKAPILAEIVGYGVSCNGAEIISQPNSEGMKISILRALDDAQIHADDIDYINAASAISSYNEDKETAIALKSIFEGKKAWISSTQSISGHEFTMEGASEVVYTILMMQNGFIAPNINLEKEIKEAVSLRIAKEAMEIPIRYALVNSSGLGGINSALVLKNIYDE